MSYHIDIIDRLARLDFNRNRLWIVGVTYGRIPRDTPDTYENRKPLEGDGYLMEKASFLERHGILKLWGTLDPDNRRRLADAVLDYDSSIHDPDKGDTIAFNDSIETAPGGGPMP